MSKCYPRDKFVIEVARYEYHPIKGTVLLDSYIITFDGNFQVWHNGEIVYESFARGACVSYADRCLEQIG